MLFGLLTALFWGVTDFLIKLLGGRLSLKSSLVWTQGASALAVLALVLAGGRLPLAGLPPSVLPMLLAVAVTNAFGLGLLYAAFQNGRVAVVAPVIGSYAIVATAIGMATGTEAVSAPLLVTLAVISAGAMLVMLESGGDGGLRPRAGAAAAAGSALFSGLSIWLAAVHVLPTTPVADVLFANFALLAIAAALWPAGRIERPVGRVTWAIILGIAAGCVAGYGFYNVGLARGGIAVVSVLATLSSAVTTLLAAAVLKEQVRGIQRLGLTIVLLGLPLLALIREMPAG
ncbi:DMT family transporter [Sphingomonas solaris]|uniref:DMT family transporter n=1 Tax=Alterirhizorhabdus solaris TaxID=2529389 RepID=A0A558RD51_9SPHN|nr:DMT family transporter [Sphingomonas solaris]TVV77260.1 DMT family transporter [Sphingomonas solaris]